MSKVVAEIAIGAGLIALDFLIPGFAVAHAALASLLLGTGASLVFSGIGTLLSKQQTGLGSTVRNPVAPWNVVYGRAKVGGTTIFIETTGDTNKYLHMVFAIACHPCESVDALLFDDKRVALDASGNSLSFNDSTDVIAVQQVVNIASITRVNDVVTVVLVSPLPRVASTVSSPAMMDGDVLAIRNVTTDATLNGSYAITVINDSSFSYICGGSPASITGEGSVKTTFPDYGDTVHMEVLLGNHADTFPTLLSGPDGSDGLWTADCRLLGRTSVYLRAKWSGGNEYISGLPTIGFLVHGKNNIFDPRWGDAVDSRDPRASGYTENAALCIADYLANQTFGYKALYETEIPSGPLASAANICDESVPLANGGFEPRYTCNGGFQLTTKRGEVLQNLLTSCAGRLTYVGGQFFIYPAAWIGPSATWTAGVPTNANGSPVASGRLTVWATFTNTSGAPATPKVVAFAGVPGNTGLVGSGPSISTIAQGDFVDMDLAGISGTPKAFSYDLSPYAEVPLLGVMNIATFIEGTLDSVGTLATMTIYDAYVDLTYADASTVRLRPHRATYINQDDGSGVNGLVTNPANAINAEGSPPTTFATITRSTYGGTAFAGYLLLSGFEFPGGSTVTPSTLGLGDLAGPFQWKQKVSIRDLYNGAKGIFVCPANHWQASDIPPYAQDSEHGYHSGSPEYPLGDANLAADGGDRRWLDLQLPFTISSSMAQRICKIELLRRRFGGTGTFAFNLAMYQLTAMDVVAFTLPVLGWSSKLLEVSQHRFTINKSENQATVLGTELDLKETDPSIYEWSVNEELSAQGFSQAPSTSEGAKTVAAPTGVTATSDPSTASVGADGVSTSTIKITWDPPTDGFVLNGGHVIVEYQLAASPLSSVWISLGTFAPTTTVAYINGVSDGVAYYVRVAFVNAAGAQSRWTTIGPITAGGSSLPAGLRFADDEIPAGAMDGTNQTFTLAHAPNPPGSLRLYYDGVKQTIGSASPALISLSGSTITFLIAFPDASMGETLRAFYRY